MGILSTVDDEALTFAYADELSGSTLALYEGPLELTRDEQTESLEGEIRLSLAPFLSFTFTLTGRVGVLISPRSTPQRVSIKFPEGEGGGGGNIWSSHVDGEPPDIQRLNGHLDGAFLKGQKCETRELRFLVPNFTDFCGSPIPGRDDQPASRLLVESSEFEIVIDEVSELPTVLGRLAAEGGYAITHQGRIRRRDFGPITFDDAMQLTETLTWWLSLLRGERTGPLLVSGVHGDVVDWELWRSPGVHSWTGPKSWLPDDLDAAVTKSLGVMFDRLDVLEKAKTSEPVHRLIDWYAQSQHGEHTGAIIVTTQAGLELAAWLSLVLDKGKDDYDKREDAWVRIKAALDEAGISHEIPTSLDYLREDSKGTEHPLNGPKVITEFRNNMIHPKMSQRQRISSPTFQLQCLQLAIRFLEMLILHRLGYVGKAKDKADNDWIERDVPWAQ
jgi:hypothetical protein